MAKKRKPADATIRNVKASNRRDAAIGSRLTGVEARVAELERKIGELVHAFRAGLAKI